MGGGVCGGRWGVGGGGLVGVRWRVGGNPGRVVAGGVGLGRGLQGVGTS